MSPRSPLDQAVSASCEALVTDLDDSLLDQGGGDGRKDTVLLRPDTLTALDAFIGEGGTFIINTGRRRSDLLSIPVPVIARDVMGRSRLALRVPRHEEPRPLVADLSRRAAAVVMEMGAVVWFPAQGRIVRFPAGDDQRTWDARLAGLRRALEASGVPGSVLWVGDRVLSTKAEYRGQVAAALAQLGLDGTMEAVLNNPSADLANPNAALNICPRGVTKATGLRAALTHLGLSENQATGFGNSFASDWSFLRVCGASVAPANADAPLKAAVTAVTRGERGAGGTELLQSLTRELHQRQTTGPNVQREVA